MIVLKIMLIGMIISMIVDKEEFEHAGPGWWKLDFLVRMLILSMIWPLRVYWWFTDK